MALKLKPKSRHSAMAWLGFKQAALKRQYPAEEGFIATAMNDLRVAVAYENHAWKILEKGLLMTLTSRRRPPLRDSLYMMAAECFARTRGQKLEGILRGPGLKYMKTRAPSPMLARYKHLLGLD